MSLLAAKQAAAKATPAPAAESGSMLSRARAAYPRGEHVTVPLLGRVWIELAGEAVTDQIESETMAAMAALKIPFTPLNATTYDARRTALTLAWAVRDPENHDVRAGTAEEWMAMDAAFLSAIGTAYGDVQERLNPMASGTLTAEEFDQIRLAHEKKNPAMLRIFGLASLSNYLATTAAPPASSPTPPPSDGQS